MLLLLLLLTALLSLEGVSLVDGLLPSEAGSEYMGGGGCRLKDKFDRKMIRFSTFKSLWKKSNKTERLQKEKNVLLCFEKSATPSAIQFFKRSYEISHPP